MCAWSTTVVVPASIDSIAPPNSPQKMSCGVNSEAARLPVGM